jgi:plastocyanin
MRRLATMTIGAAMLGGLACGAMSIPAWASGGGGCGRPVTDARGSQVRIKQFCFTPTVLHIRRGQAVRFTNLDLFPHTVQGASVSWGSWDALGGDRSVTYTFKRSGVYPYVCTVHPGMVGAIVVGTGNGPGGAGLTTTERGPVIQGTPARASLVRASIDGGSNGPWPVTTFVGFGMFAVAGAALLLRRKSFER